MGPFPETVRDERSPAWWPSQTQQFMRHDRTTGRSLYAAMPVQKAVGYSLNTLPR